MPMFFIVSGLLFSPRPARFLLEKKLRSLIVPYFAFLISLSLLISMRSLVVGRDNPLLAEHGLRNLVLGGEYLRGDFGVFWFMTSLLFTQLVFNVLLLKWKSPAAAQVIAAVVALYLAGYLAWYFAQDLRAPWGLGVVPFGLPFMWFGNLMNTKHMGPKAGWLACVVIISLALGLGGAGVHYAMDLKFAQPGPIFIGIALAIAISWLFFQLMKVLSALPRLSAPFEIIGASAMTIMFAHQFVHLSLRMAGIKSEFVLIGASVVLPMAFWAAAKRMPLASALFLGTARQIPGVSRRLCAH